MGRWWVVRDRHADRQKRREVEKKSGRQTERHTNNRNKDHKDKD